MKITVRNATFADASDIFALERACIDMPWTKAQIEDETTGGNAVFFVAECDGVFCGYVSGDVCLGECEMNNIAVAEAFRGNGIGYALMSRFLNELKTRKVDTVYLLVRDNNTAARALYEKTGFEQVGTRKNYYNGGHDALAMRLYIV